MSPPPVPTWGNFVIWQWFGWGVALVVVMAAVAIISHRGIRRGLARSAAVTLSIARVTVAETLRKKVLYGIVVFAVGSVLAATFFSSYEPGEQDVVVKDIGLTLISMFAGLVVIITAMFLIPEEVERRTIYPLLAKPVRRSEFVVGKFLGVAAPVAISMGAMLLVLQVAMLAIKFPAQQSWIVMPAMVAVGVVFIGMLMGKSLGVTGPVAISLGALVILAISALAIVFNAWSWLIVMAVGLLFFAMMVLAGVVILISTRVSTILAAVIGVLIFALGFNMERLYHLADPQHSGGHVFNTISLSVLAAVLPNLSMFDLRVQAASPPPYYWDQLWALFGNGVLYAVGYLAVLLIAASLSFSTREV